MLKKNIFCSIILVVYSFEVKWTNKCHHYMPNLALKLGVLYRITAPVILLCSVG